MSGFEQREFVWPWEAEVWPSPSAGTREEDLFQAALLASTL